MERKGHKGNIKDQNGPKLCPNKCGYKTRMCSFRGKSDETVMFWVKHSTVSIALVLKSLCQIKRPSKNYVSMDFFFIVML